MELPEPPDFETLASRLRWAIDQQPAEGRKRGLRLFQRRMEEAGGKGLEGTALSSIQAYLKGTAPSLAWTEVAAVVLGVRVAWLAFGVGFPTDGEQDQIEALAKKSVTVPASTARAIAKARKAQDAQGAALTETLSRRLPVFWNLPPAARRAVVEGLMRYAKRAASAESFQETFDRYARYLAAPFEIAGIDAEALGPAELALIFEGLLRALDIASWTTNPGEG